MGYLKIVINPGVLIFTLILFLSCGEKKAQGHFLENANTDRPNIIIIMTDDQGYGDLGYHGNPYMKTPNLDKFAAESLELTNFHVGTTCAPTRAGLMTGRNANRNNAWHTIAGCSILLEDEEMIAEVFARNGYSTKMIGKWHLGDNFPFRPQDRGFQDAFYHGGGGVQQTPDYWNNDYFDDTYFRNGIPEATSGYCTDVWFNEAIDYIKNKDESPFLMYLAPNAAHGPFNVPESYAKMYAEAALDPVQKRFYGMVSNIDDNFGRLLKILKEEDLFDNTILIFTTDNGTARGIYYSKEEDKYLGYNAGLRGTKGSHYDGGHRVPFFMSWPNGGISSKKSNALASHVDILPTLAELSNIRFRETKPLDGKSIAAVIKGEKKAIKRMLVIDTQRNQLPEKGRNSSVMSDGWRLIDGKELYNTFDDPGQKKDLALVYPDTLAAMQHFYDNWWQSIEKDIRYAEIPIGMDQANPTMISIHDMHTEDNLPWNQVQIREAKFAAVGYYSVKVAEDGLYRFNLYRYPPEADKPLNGIVSEIPGTPFINSLPPGKELNLVKAEVFMNDEKFTATINSNQNYVTLEGRLRQGSYELRSYFLTNSGNQIPAYYTHIEKL